MEEKNRQRYRSRRIQSLRQELQEPEVRQKPREPRVARAGGELGEQRGARAAWELGEPREARTRRELGDQRVARAGGEREEQREARTRRGSGERTRGSGQREPGTSGAARRRRALGEGKGRKRRRRRRKPDALRLGICGVLLVLGILLVYALILFGSALTKSIKGGDFSGFSFPWSKAEAVIMLDAGHGGKDQGTSYGDILEKELTLEITKEVEKLLKDAGYAVEMTRTGDDSVDVYQRSRLANREKPDVFVSIHCNFLERGEASGIETYYGKDRDEDCQSLAEKIQASAIEKTGAVDRGARTEDFVVVKETKMPAALIEVGFLSDPGERELLQDAEYQKKLAQGIADGIIGYWEEKKAAEEGEEGKAPEDE